MGSIILESYKGNETLPIFKISLRTLWELITESLLNMTE